MFFCYMKYNKTGLFSQKLEVCLYSVIVFVITEMYTHILRITNLFLLKIGAISMTCGLFRWPGKESACHYRGHKRRVFDPWSGSSPGVGNANPFQYCCLENSLDIQDWKMRWTVSTRSQKSWTRQHALICTQWYKMSIVEIISWKTRIWAEM